MSYETPELRRMSRSLEETDPDVAAADKLKINVYPNPATNFVNVSMTLSEVSDVNVAIYDMQGKQVGTYNYGRQSSGDHIFNLQTSSLKQGTYFVRMQAGSATQTTKILILNQ